MCAGGVESGEREKYVWSGVGRRERERKTTRFSGKEEAKIITLRHALQREGERGRAELIRGGGKAIDM